MKIIKIHYFILFTAFLLTFTKANAQSSWFWLQPLPTGATLNSVDFFDRNTGYTCGKAGTVTKTTNGGLNWVLLGQITSVNLTDIECIDFNTCIVVGDSGYIAKTTNGGINWFSISGGTTNLLNEISFPNMNTGYICGFQGIVLKTTNSGNNWTIIQNGMATTLYSISFIDADRGSAGGFNAVFTTTNGGLNWTTHQLGSFFDTFESVNILNDSTIFILWSGDHVICRTTNFGNSWDYFQIKSIDPDNLERGMIFRDLYTGFITTQYGDILKSTNGGVNWFFDTTFMPVPRDINIFWDINKVDSSTYYTVGGGGLIARTTNTGGLWEKQTGNIKTYNDIYFTTVNTGYIVGEKGLLIKTTDSGLNWSNIDLGTTVGLNKVFFTTENTGYICGDTGLLRKTTNAGLNWVSQTTPAGDTNILSITFADENTGFLGMARGSILKTSNSGNNWERVFTLTGTGTPSIFDIDFLNSSTGAAAATNRIVLTTNSGLNWTITNQNGNDLITICYQDSMNIVSGGYLDRIRKSTNGGFSWFNINDMLGDDIISMFFWDSNFGVMCGNSGKVARTTNGGTNWIHQPVIASEFLNSVFFINPNTGFSAGQGGQIIKTTNGGLSFINSSVNYLPSYHQLYQNYPNPFNPSTKIKFQMIMAGYAEIKVYNINGKYIRTLLSENRNYGTYEIEFNAASAGGGLPSGIYFYELIVNNNLIDSKKCLLIK